MAKLTGGSVRRLVLWAGPALVLGGAVALVRAEDAKTTGTELKQPSALSATETSQQSREYMTQMEGTQRRIVKLQDVAAKVKDVVKLNCVNDKLVQVRGHLAIANQTIKNLNTSISRGDDGGRQHEFTRMTILYQKVLVLGTEAENCVGEDASYVGATRVDVEIDPNLPQEDPTAAPLPMPDVTRPPQASPFA